MQCESLTDCFNYPTINVLCAFEFRGKAQSPPPHRLMIIDLDSIVHPQQQQQCKSLSLRLIIFYYLLYPRLISSKLRLLLITCSHHPFCSSFWPAYSYSSFVQVKLHLSQGSHSVITYYTILYSWNWWTSNIIKAVAGSSTIRGSRSNVINLTYLHDRPIDYTVELLIHLLSIEIMLIYHWRSLIIDHRWSASTYYCFK